jgi:hypothetical protein
VEDLTDPVSQGEGITVGPSVNYLPDFPFYARGPAEIGDNEAQLYVGYENGVAVQSYWSERDNAFIIPGSGATQNRLALNNHRLVVSGGVSGSLTNASVSLGSTGSGGFRVVVNGEAVEYGPGQVTSIDIRLGGGTNTVDLQAAPFGVTSITVEGAGNTTLMAPGGVSNVWHNAGAGSGTLDIGSQVGIVTFSGVTNETGGGTDDFKFEGGSVPGYIDGGAGPGVATLDYSAVSGPVTVNLQAGTASSIGLTFRNINNFVGSGSPADALVGPDATWDINGANAGSVNGLTFSSFENLTGGTGPDQFVFRPGGSISGSIDGGGGTNTLDYSNLPGPVAVNLQTATATGVGGTFRNVSQFIGGGGPNTVVGPNSVSSWVLAGLNAVTVGGGTSPGSRTWSAARPMISSSSRRGRASTAPSTAAAATRSTSRTSPGTWSSIWRSTLRPRSGRASSTSRTSPAATATTCWSGTRTPTASWAGPGGTSSSAAWVPIP